MLHWFKILVEDARTDAALGELVDVSRILDAADQMVKELEDMERAVDDTQHELDLANTELQDALDELDELKSTRAKRGR